MHLSLAGPGGAAGEPEASAVARLPGGGGASCRGTARARRRVRPCEPEPRPVRAGASAWHGPRDPARTLRGAVPLLLILIFIVVPIVEIFVIIQVGEAIGPLWTVALLIADSILG